MKPKRSNIFSAIRTEGALLPADFLLKVSEGDPSVPGLRPSDYHLLENERLNEAINHSWNRLVPAWKALKKALKMENMPGALTGVTRERWLLPLFQELGYGRLTPSKAIEIEGKIYPISHFWNNVPIHLLGIGIALDRRTPGAHGAARQSPHSLVQEFLNRSEAHLWAFVSNGLRLRILRDNVSLTRQAYVEFDLEAIMEGEIYSDFAVLWLLCHQSRVEGDPPEECWLEKWTKLAYEQGTRALEHLREGVRAAINALGTGLLSCPQNTVLRKRLKEGDLSPQDFYRQLLRFVYRLIFLFAAEDRGLLLVPEADKKAKEIYNQYYSTKRLRKLAETMRGSRHVDLGRMVFLIFEKLDTGCKELALPALGSFLWSKEAISDLVGQDIENHHLLSAIRYLSFIIDGATRRPIDYRNIGSEELGSIYESFLEFHPELNIEAGTFEIKTSAGHERKSTGSYYTPTSLINSLLDTALEPVVEARLSEAKSRVANGEWQKEAEKALLSLKICDPACGSGHFLIAAAHRLAKRLASIRTGDAEPGPDAQREALRDVISKCIYGVDINPMAVELCKVNLWMEALVPGHPLSFLDHHIRCGNSLLGTTPALIKLGIPDEAFKPVEGDDKKFCTSLRKENKRARKGQKTLWKPDTHEPWRKIHKMLAQEFSRLVNLADENIESVREKEAKYGNLIQSDTFITEKLIADAWCAAFVWEKTTSKPYPVTEETFRKLKTDPSSLSPETINEIERLAKEYQFFHWHIEFPDVFSLPPEGQEAENEHTGLNGGFDVVLGNPPWERIKLQEKEFFSSRDLQIAKAKNKAKRERLIKALAQSAPELFKAFHEEKRKSEAQSHFIRNSGRYPLCGRGDVNTYSIFAELKRDLMSPTGRVGCIVPSGIATDDTTKFFFQSLMEKKELSSLYDFENRNGIFPGVHRSYKFSLLTMTGRGLPAVEGAEFAFFLHDPSELKDKKRRFTLSARDIALINPNTKTCPIFRTRQDAELTKAIYRRVPVLIKEGASHGNPWGMVIKRFFDMNQPKVVGMCRQYIENNNLSFWERMFEAKLFHQFDHRWATYHDTKVVKFTENDKTSPQKTVMPRYWIPSLEVEKRLKRVDKNGKLIWEWTKKWLIGWRDVTNTTNERTIVASILPKSGTDFTIRIAMPQECEKKGQITLVSNFNSFCLDFVARQLMGGTHLSDYITKQLPVLPPSTYSSPTPWDKTCTLSEWLLPRVLELTYTSWDLKPFAEDCGYDGPPFKWNDERRFLLRSELDAAFFHLYLGTQEEWEENATQELLEFFPTPRDAVSYIMETFPIVKRKDEQKYGTYLTKETILKIYDLMAEAIATDTKYNTTLNPPPADPSCAHPIEDK